MCVEKGRVLIINQAWADNSKRLPHSPQVTTRLTKTMMSKALYNGISTLLLVALSSMVLAEPPDGKGYKKGYSNSERGAGKVHGQNDLAGSMDLISAGINASDARRIARDLGFRGYKPLPPGIKKNLARGKPLPPGIAKSRLPTQFTGRLPYHKGYEWLSAGSDLVLVSQKSQVVSDVLRDVFE